MIPLIGKLRHGNHLQGLIGDGVGKNLHIVGLYLFVALEPGSDVDDLKGPLIRVRALALAFVRHGNGDGGYAPASVRQAQGDGGAVLGLDGDGHIFKGKLGGACVSPDQQITDDLQNDHSFHIPPILCPPREKGSQKSAAP